MDALHFRNLIHLNWDFKLRMIFQFGVDLSEYYLIN